MITEKIIGVLAEFHKDASKRLNLFSIYVVSEGKSWDGKKDVRWADGYDVEWSKTYGSYIFHYSSSGMWPKHISGIYFLSGDVKVKEKPCELVDAHDNPPWKSKRTRIIRERNRTRRLKKLPKSFDMSDSANLFEWLQNNGIESGATWCSECRDWLPEDAYVLCDHCWWCTKTGLYSTPHERCKCKNRDECDERN